MATLYVIGQNLIEIDPNEYGKRRFKANITMFGQTKEVIFTENVEWRLDGPWDALSGRIGRGIKLHSCGMDLWKHDNGYTLGTSDCSHNRPVYPVAWNEETWVANAQWNGRK